METGLLTVTVFCMVGLMFCQTEGPMATVYAGAGILYLGLLVKAMT